jgi:hypothetical protein
MKGRKTEGYSVNKIQKINSLRKHEKKREMEIQFQINLKAGVVNKTSTLYIGCTKFKNNRM